MKRNILIVEDNKESMEALAGIVKECESAGAVYCARDSASAYKYAMERRIDLFLVDIMLDNTVKNDVSGMVFADKIRGLEQYEFVPLIFITCLEDYKHMAFQNLHCYGYLEKPFDFERVKETVAKALRYPLREEQNKRFVYYRREGLIFSLDTERLVYMESVNRNLLLHLVDEEVEIPYRTCSSMQQELNEEIFLQCSRTVVVNRNYIDCVDKTNRYLKMKNGKTLEIGMIFKKKFLKKLRYED